MIYLHINVKVRKTSCSILPNSFCLHTKDVMQHTCIFFLSAYLHIIMHVMYTFTENVTLRCT